MDIPRILLGMSESAVIGRLRDLRGRLLAMVFLFAGLGLIQACSHPLEISGRGDVVDDNGSSRGCTLEQFEANDKACTRNMVVGEYNVNYKPVPKPGWGFVRWDGTRCNPSSVAPNCSFSVKAATVKKFWFEVVPATIAVFEDVPEVWKSEAQVDPADTLGTSVKPQVAIDGNGNAIAVWEQRTSGATYIRASHYSAGSGWSPSQQIGRCGLCDAGGMTDGPQIAMDAAGNATVVWSRSDGLLNSIYAVRFAGGSWTVETLIESDTTGTNLKPQVATDAGGNVIAVWERRTPGASFIQANRFAADAGWGTDQRIGRCGTCDALGMTDGPQIAMDAAGNATAIWSHSDDGMDSIYTNRFAGSWGSETLIEADTTGNNLRPQVAMDESGNAFAVWERRTSGASYIQANRLTGGSWSTEQQIGRCGICDEAGMTDGPQIAMDAVGNATVVWSRSDGQLNSIYASRYTDSWSAESLVEADATGTNLKPQIAMDGDGNAMAVWERRTSGASYIQASRNDGTGWATDQQIGRCGICDAVGMSDGPQIAMGSHGLASATWARSSGSRLNIYAAMYE